MDTTDLDTEQMSSSSLALLSPNDVDSLYEPPSNDDNDPKTILFCILAALTVAVITVTVTLYFSGKDADKSVIVAWQHTTASSMHAVHNLTDAGHDWTHSGPTDTERTESTTMPVNLTVPHYRLPRDVRPTHYNLTISVHKDIDVGNFTGKVDIYLVCQAATVSISVHSGAGMQLRANFSDGINVLGYTTNGDVVTMTLDKTLERGTEYVLSIEYENLFALPGEEGFFTDHEPSISRVTYVTFFEPTGARRAFPCFDEPDIKATFCVSVLHSQTLHAISNMPIIGSRPSGDGMILTSFQKTPVMSTYLVAWAVTNFKHMTKGRVSVWAEMHTEDHRMSEALELGLKSLKYCEDFFGIPYDLPHLSMVGISAFSLGGMENWGMIVYKDTLLLGDVDTEQGPNSVVILHETFHQWSGNRMTNTWWNDIWVQEGPVYYLSQMGAGELEPDKGHSHYLIRTIHLLLGDVDFKAALSATVIKYDRRNLDGYEFLRSMTEFQTIEPKVDIYAHMLSWFESDSIPELHFYRNYNNRTVTAIQHPLNIARDLYHIPIIYSDNKRGQDLMHPIRANVSHWMAVEQEYYTDPYDHQTALILNPGMTGYYLVNYDERNWALIGQFVANNPNVMDAALVKQLFISSGYFYNNKQISIASHLWIWDCLKNVADPSYWILLYDKMSSRDKYLVGLVNDDRYRLRLLEIAEKVATTVSYTSSHFAYQQQAVFNGHMKVMLCALDHRDCVRIVLDAWQKKMQHINSFNDLTQSLDVLDGEPEAVLCIIVRHSGLPTLNKIKSWLNAVAGVTKARWEEVLFEAMACSNDDTILTEAINFARATWQSRPSVERWSYKVRRLLLDYFLQLNTTDSTERSFAKLIAAVVTEFVEADADIKKLEQQIDELYGPTSRDGESIKNHAHKKLQEKQRDIPHFKRWLDRQLPPVP
ncbi:aminopeptidase N-like isoform X2 [Ornithodoros turicata]|uniref:aminopeptidase N-like isoform X2 n=1 Tax=Ornithodoros turicata TaxID=34597 RepID=UPI00313924DE